ncbi:MAG: hypothetical protein VZR36_11725 [Prevotella sp.]|nr:hypothetical protein [Prevotella sp.]
MLKMESQVRFGGRFPPACCRNMREPLWYCAEILDMAIFAARIGHKTLMKQGTCRSCALNRLPACGIESCGHSFGRIRLKARASARQINHWRQLYENKTFPYGFGFICSHDRPFGSS